MMIKFERNHMKNIGFIGASGMMGHGMARNIQAKGFDLTVSVNRNRDAVADLAALGATVVDSPAGLGSCDAVLICVTGSPQVEAVMLGVNGQKGLLSAAKRGLIIIDTSTSEPESTAKLAALCAQAGVVYVDAPLGRSPVQAEEGKLNTMVGATPEVFAQIQPILATYCENIFHVGGPGAGHIVKLLNNFVAQAICTATAEAFTVGAKAGIDPAELVKVISAGPVNNGLFQAMAKTLDGDFAGLKFELDNARKDLRYYTHLAEMVNVPSFVGEAVHQSLSTASNLGFGHEYVPSLVKAQEKLTGVKYTL
jgi:3-hydroxyisobutyrate dehydrogenase-like beta-hydroxyacid dehydrogenase